MLHNQLHSDIHAHVFLLKISRNPNYRPKRKRIKREEIEKKEERRGKFLKRFEKEREKYEELLSILGLSC